MQSIFKIGKQVCVCVCYCVYLYLSIDGTDDSCAQPHACYKAVLKMLMQDECLEKSTTKHEEGQSEAPPWRHIFLFGELNQHPDRHIKGHNHVISIFNLLFIHCICRNKEITTNTYLIHQKVYKKKVQKPHLLQKRWNIFLMIICDSKICDYSRGKKITWCPIPNLFPVSSDS